MVKNFAKFTATMGKGIKVGDSDVEIKLTLPLKVVQENFLFLSTNQGEKINVFLGDPQAALDFGDDEEDMYKPWKGRRVTTDASGVVTTVEQPDEQKDENQAELNFDESGSVGSAEHSGGQAEDPAGDPPPAKDGDELNDYEKEIMGEGSKQEGSDLPEWMQQEQQQEQSGGQEMSFEESDQDPADNDVSEAEEAQASSGEDISKEELEEYILKERPAFEDIPLDFPMFLEKSLNEGKTWVEISKIAGVPSSQLQPKWKKYKEMVTKMMRDGGVA
ncbi:hypothetical protein ACI2LM_18220 [Paenibacillus lautus]|uniref:hypothetical protein n=1 Tax=Paenibacillus lautus TaxID=1401 RepID=UPI00384EEEB1